MSRREEVEKQLADIDFANSDYEGNWYAVRPLARTLADEVDAEREIVTKLLAMLNEYAVPWKTLPPRLRDRREDGVMFTCKTYGEQAGFTTGAPTQVVFCSCYTDTLIAQRDRLAAENAELRKQVEDWKTGSTHEARYGDEARRELAAANATLDKMRAVVPEGALCYCYECEAFVVGGDVRRSYNKRCPKCQCEKLVAFAYDLQSILYPTPETPNEH